MSSGSQTLLIDGSYNFPALFADVWNKKLRLRHVRNSNGQLTAIAPEDRRIPLACSWQAIVLVLYLFRTLAHFSGTLYLLTFGKHHHRLLLREGFWTFWNNHASCQTLNFVLTTLPLSSRGSVLFCLYSVPVCSFILHMYHILFYYCYCWL